MKYLNRIIGGSATIVMVFGFSSCMSFLPKPKSAPTVYRLSIPVNSSQMSVENKIVINIGFPQAPRALSGTDIVLSPDGRRLTAAGGALWAEPVPNQIQLALIDALASNKQITGVMPKGGIRAHYRLNIEIRRFEAIFDNGEEAAPKALVQLDLTLTDTKTRELMGKYSARQEIRARAKTVSAIVDAQDSATSAAMGEISDWLNSLVDGKS